MSPLNYGLTPKMRPISRKRTTLVAALDIGTSKFACLIGRLKPQGPQEHVAGGRGTRVAAQFP